MRLASKQNQLNKNAQNAFLVQMPEKLLSHVRLCTLLSQFFGCLIINNIYRISKSMCKAILYCRLCIICVHRVQRLSSY